MSYCQNNYNSLRNKLYILFPLLWWMKIFTGYVLEEILGIQNCFLIPLASRVVLSHGHGCLETSTNGLLLHAVLMLQRTKTLNKTMTKSVCGPMNQSRPRWKARSLASKCPQEPHFVAELCKAPACREKEADMGWRPSLMKSIL